MYLRRDPGPCPVDDAPHTTCCAPAAAGIVIVQLPNRDQVSDPPLIGGVHAPGLAGGVPMPLRAEAIQATLPPGHVTTGTYRRKRSDR